MLILVLKGMLKLLASKYEERTVFNDGEMSNFFATDIPTKVGAIHQYTIDWAALSQGEKGVTVKIDSDGNDVVERTIITNNSFQPLIAEFTVSPENPLIGEKVTLDASTSFDLGGGEIKKYRWEFYNAANQDPFYVIEGHDKKIISYSFTSEGIYLVRLTVTDDEGEYSYTESSITIKEPAFYVPDDYPSIQAAVDAASAGDTIIVRDGTYTENVAVNKRLTIQSENGYKNCIVKPAKSNEHVFTVTADYENISGFTVKGALTEWDYTSYGGSAGIYLDHVNYCNISNNNALNNHNGIHLRDSSHICITNNNVQSNKNAGIFLSTSSNNIIDNNKASFITLWWSSNNNVLTNNNATISLYFASNNILTNNKGSEINLRSYSNNNIANNNIIGAGISLDSCSNNSILTNTLGDKGISIYGRNLSHFNTHIIRDNVINGKPIYYYKNNKGIKVTETGGQIILANCSNIIVENISNGRIDLAYTNDSKISNNNVSKIEVRYSSNDTIANNNVRNGDGINIEYSSNNKIISNNVSNNSYGIFIGISSNNVIVNNIVNSNINDGITLDGSPDNVIYFNNFVGNGRNVCAYGLNNIWNSPAPITYTYNGNTYTNYLGNYWDDYTDVDTDNDGIWDNPYSINCDSPYSIDTDQDLYPLMTWSEHYLNPPYTIPTQPPPVTPSPLPTSNYTFSLHGNAILLWSYVNEEQDAEIDFGILDDINGDGIEDIPIFDCSVENVMLVISGKDGSTIWSKNYLTKIDMGNCDDVNGDGIGDIIINYEETNESSLIVELVSGCDGSEIWRKNVGEYDAAHAIYRDLDGDGILDILLEDSDYNYPSWRCEICTLSAIDGSKLWNKTFEGDVQGYCYCDQDVTGDSIYDFIISAYNRNTNIGELFAIRGSDGYVEWHKSFTGNPNCWGFSRDDFDGDGLPDVELEIRDSTDNSTKVLVLKGSDGSIIWSKLYNLAASGYGFDDINADGTTDLCLELRDFATFRLTELQVLSGLDGSKIWSKEVDVSDVASCDDLNGDGKRDILLVKSTKLAENSYSYDVIAISGSGEGKIWENSFKYNIEMDVPEGASGYISAYAGSVRDFNGDEIKDTSLKIRYNDYYCSANKLFFISGKDGSELWNVEDTLNERTYVWNHYIPRYDFNNDGISDVLLGTKKGVYLLATTP